MGISSEIPVTLGDKRQYYLDQCEGDVDCLSETNKVLDSYGIEEGEAFLGVSYPRSLVLFKQINFQSFSMIDILVWKRL